MRITAREKAGLRPPLRKPPPLDLNRIEAVSLHWEVPGVRILSRKHRTRSIQRFHQTKWSDIAYSFTIERDGTVVEGRGFRWQAFAEGTAQRAARRPFPEFLTVGESANPYYISVLLVGCGPKNDAPTDQQWLSLDRLVANIRNWRGRADLPVDGHGSHRVKACPGPALWQAIDGGRWDSPAAPWYDQPLEEAVRAGITDGSDPTRLVTRAEAAIMAHRAYKHARNA